MPPIARRIGPFEFCGISIPSGEVGGDLIDLVESNGHWIGYVADVSGHGVGAGLLMGMAKSSARTQLRVAEPMNQLLNTLNAVLFDLRKPDMYMTFAGLQFDGASELQFSVAGHLPILRYRPATSAIEELSVSQLPLAMFEDQAFVSAPAQWTPGDLFVILTDGLTEVFDRHDQEFGMDRIKALICARAGRTPLEALQSAILDAVKATRTAAGRSDHPADQGRYSGLTRPTRTGSTSFGATRSSGWADTAQSPLTILSPSRRPIASCLLWRLTPLVLCDCACAMLGPAGLLRS